MVPRYSLSLVAGIVATIFTTPALATARCPPEYGEKSAIVLVAGWAVMAAGFVAGSALMRYAFLRSRNRTWAFQLFILLTGIVGMVFTWFMGLLAALNGFFLTC
jgi:hypothetical protein